MNGNIIILGDKFILYCVVMFGFIVEGKIIIKGFLFGVDCLSMILCFKEMGVEIM